MISAVEFYSGIGGLHLALSRCSLPQPVQILASYDWDQTACRVYHHNFPSTSCRRTDISVLSPDDIPVADLWLLSPACQPYTTLNPNAKGADDPRAKSFLHLIQRVLPQMSEARRPDYMLVENVAGFESSTTRQTLSDTLSSLGYHTTELVLSPSQFGVPNSRRRYYMLARKFPFNDQLVPPSIQTSRIETYLSASIGEEYGIPQRVLQKWGRLFDIVRPGDARSCCFTRGYTQLVERAGSILQMQSTLDTTQVFDEFLAAQAAGDVDAVKILAPLRLRYFAPEELLRLFDFNPTEDEEPFSFPDDISRKSRYRLIGNSVNVRVVRALIEYLLTSTDLLGE
ncbi:S-adenosyl-L-methionine-dependent methyltransferase [Hymenopellis radicata]|nr:S-adenosyl-L-methionine-dependent methyltransferase [Hymenopellis radicata]